MQLDFEHDNRLFIDPYKIDENKSLIHSRAKSKILKFFELFFYFVKNNMRDSVEAMGEHLHEINSTKLGYSRTGCSPKGKGFCKRDLLIIYDEAIKIKNYIEDMPDILVFAEKIGSDKISDLVTNIIYEELLEFTKNIIDKYNLSISVKKTNKWIFNVETIEWRNKELMIPYIGEEELLFVPKDVAAPFQIFSYSNTYDKLVYPFYKSNTSIHNLIRFLKNGEIRPDCKKIAIRYPKNRGVVKEFRDNYRDKYNLYKEGIVENLWGKYKE